MMSLGATLIYCMLWSTCLAIPMWRYYGDAPVYRKRQVDRYRPVDPRQGYDDWRDGSRDYRYNNMPRGYEDLREEPRWPGDGYGQMDGWEERDAMWPDSQPVYDPLPGDVTYSEVARALQKWKDEEEQERGSRYGTDDDTFYIQVDDNSRNWRKEPVDQGDVEDIFNGRSSDNSQRFMEERRSRDGLDPLQNIGMRLVDLTKEMEAEKEVEDKEDEVKVYVNHDDDQPGDKTQPISAGKAKSLLKSLEDEEKAREEKTNADQSKELLDKAEVEAMLNKRSEEEKSSDDDEEDSQPAEEYDLVPSNKNTANKGKFNRDDLEKAERQLLKEENEILIEALQKAPMELVRSPFTRQQLKALIEGAETRQQLVDHIDSQLAKTDD